MAHCLRLGEPRQADRRVPLQAAKPALHLRLLRQIDTGDVRAGDLEDQRLLDLQARIAAESPLREQYCPRRHLSSLICHGASTASSASA